HLIKTGRKGQFPPNLLDRIPNKLHDRRTVLGGLNWIVVAITDTIAWNTLPRDDFQRFFRQKKEPQKFILEPSTLKASQHGVKTAANK
ncbi:hypothetical protein TELCIR_17812, partial [Teladorsagia circumcincta]